MGGVLRLGKAARIFQSGAEVTKLYHGGQVLWTKPIRSVFPNPGISTTDDVLVAGSSDMACALYSVWNLTGPHLWLSTFRENYAGENTGNVGGAPQPGYGSAITLGRQTLDQIVRNAENDQYGDDVNPLTAMGNYQVLVMDAQDQGAAWPSWVQNAAVRTSPMPMPFCWNTDGHQLALNKEFAAQIRLVRLARQSNIDRIYLTTPWPRLNHTTDATTDAAWRLLFGSVETSMHYQQDRLNFQIERETIGGHVNLIPFHKVIARIYDDIQAGTAPAFLNNIRRIFANADQTGDATVAATPKHLYMLNHIGSYAIACLIERLINNGDPRGATNTDGGLWTVPLEVATYLQTIAVQIADTYGRAGRSRGNIGYAMPRIRDRTPEQIFTGTTNLLVNSTQTLTTGATADFLRSGGIRHFYAVMTLTASQIPTTGDPVGLFNCWGTTATRRTSLRALRSADNIVMTFDMENNGPYCSATLFSADFLTRFDGTRRWLVEGYIGNNGYSDVYGLNMGFNMTDLSMNSVDTDPYVANRVYGTAHRPTTTFAATNRVNVPTAGVTLNHFIATQRNLTDQKRADIMRYLSRVHQVSTWDVFTPDLVPSAGM